MRKIPALLLAVLCAVAFGASAGAEVGAFIENIPYGTGMQTLVADLRAAYGWELDPSPSHGGADETSTFLLDPLPVEWMGYPAGTVSFNFEHDRLSRVSLIYTGDTPPDDPAFLPDGVDMYLSIAARVSEAYGAPAAVLVTCDEEEAPGFPMEKERFLEALRTLDAKSITVKQSFQGVEAYFFFSHGKDENNRDVYGWIAALSYAQQGME